MSQKKIHIVWANGRTIDILLENNPVAEYYYKCVKHLQHVNLTFNPRKNPSCFQKLLIDDVKNQLVTIANQVGLIVDYTQLDNQKYLNDLHEIYFNHAKLPKCNPTWLIVHDTMHLLEDLRNNGTPRHSIWFDYENAAGPLIKKFDRTLLQYATTDLTAGMCFIREHELGKNPVLYKQHNEPNDLITLCKQSKPWLFLKPVMSVMFENNDGYKNFQTNQEQEFNQWFAPYQEKWCAHWGISNWTPREIFAGIPIGHINELETFLECFINQDYPHMLAL